MKIYTEEKIAINQYTIFFNFQSISNLIQFISIKYQNMSQQRQAQKELKQFLTDELGQEFQEDDVQEEIQSIIKRLKTSKDITKQLKNILSEMGIKRNESNSVIKEFTKTKFYKMNYREFKPPQVIIEEIQIIPTIDNYQDQRILLNEVHQDRQKMLKQSYQIQTKNMCLEYDLYDLIMKSMVIRNQLLREQWTKLTKMNICEISSIKYSAKMLKARIQAQNRINQKITQSFTEIQNEKGNLLDHLIAIKKQLNMIDVLDLQRLINKSKSAQQCVYDKSIILFIGDTGAGKTTTILSLLGYKMEKKKFKGMTWVTTAETLTDEKLKLLHSSPQLKSITRYPLAILPKQKLDPREQIWFVDTPGFGDSAGCEVDLANGIGTIKAINNCKYVRPVIIISSQSWGTRGKGIRSLAKLLGNIFSSYQQVKNSVTFIFNRFTTEALNDLNNALQNLIDNPTPEDKTNQNLLSLYCDLVKKTQEMEDIIHFDPLKEGQYKKVQKKIIKTDKLKNPQQYFNIAFTQSTLSSIRQQCTNFNKIIKYKFDNNQLVHANYYLKIFNKMKELIPTEVPRTEYSKILKQIEKSINQKFNRSLNDLINKIRSESLEEKDIIQDKIKIQQLNKYPKLFKEFMQVPDQKIFNAQLQQQADKLIKKIEQSTQISKTLEIAKLLSEYFSIKKLQQTPKILELRLNRLEKIYESGLKLKQYQKAAEIYKQYESLLKLKLQYENKKYDITINSLIKKLPTLISEEIQKLKQASNKITPVNCTYWKNLQQNFKNIKSCYSLMLIHCSNTQLQDKIEEFKNILIQKGIKHIQSIKKIFSDLKQNRLDEISNIEEKFYQLNLLKEGISCVKIQIQSKMQECMERIQIYLGYQEKTLEQICEAIQNHDAKRKLKNLLANLERALTGIDKLAVLGNQTVKSKGASLKGKVIQSVQRFLMETSETLGILSIDLKKQTLATLIIEFEKLIKITDEMIVFKNMKKRFSQEMIGKIIQSIIHIIKTIYSYIEIQIQDIQTKGNKQYGRMNLKVIDKCVYFLEHVADRINIQELRQETENKSLKLKSELNRYKNHVQNQIISNIKFFKSLTKQSQQIDFRIKSTKIRLQQVSQIGNKFHYIRELLFENDSEQFLTEITQELQKIYEIFKKQSKQFFSKNQTDQLQIIIIKCNALHTIDKILQGSENFKSLAIQIQKQIESLCNRTSTNLKNFINGLNVIGIRRQFQKFNNGSQTKDMKETYQEAKIDLQNKIREIISEIKKKLKVHMDQQDLIPEQFEYLEKIQELMNLEEFLEYVTLNNLENLRNEIINNIKVKFIAKIKQMEEQLSDCYLESVIKKSKKLKKIQQEIKNYKIVIQYDFTLLLKEDLSNKSIIDAYENVVDKKIFEIKKKYVDDHNLKFLDKSFLTIYENICTSNSNLKQLRKLKQQMKNNIKVCYQNIFNDYENSSEVESFTLKKQIQDSFQNIPDQQAYSLKQKLKTIIQQNKNKVKGENLGQITNLFNNIQESIPQINKLIQQNNAQTLITLKSQFQKYQKNIFNDLKNNPIIFEILKTYKTKFCDIFKKVKGYDKFGTFKQYSTKISDLIQQKVEGYNVQIRKLIINVSDSKTEISNQLKQIYIILTDAYTYIAQQFKDHQIQKKFIKKFEDATKYIYEEYKKQLSIIKKISKQQPSKLKKNALFAFKILDNIEDSFKYMRQFLSYHKQKNDITQASDQFDHQKNKDIFKKEFAKKIDYLKNLKFDGDSVLTLDNIALEQFFKAIIENLNYIENYEKIYSRYNTQSNRKANYHQQCSKIIQQQIDALNNHGLQILKNFFLDPSSSLQKLNNILQFLIQYQKKFYKDNKKIFNQYDLIIKTNLGGLKKKAQQCISQMSKTIQQLKAKQLSLSRQMESKKKVKITKIIQPKQLKIMEIQKDFDRQIQNTQNQQQKQQYKSKKQIQMEKLKNQIHQFKIKITKEIEQEQDLIKSQKKKIVDQNRIKIAKILMKIKTFSMNVSYFTEVSKVEILNIIKSYQTGLGVIAINPLANTLSAQSQESANRLLAQIKCFQNYRVAEFKSKIANAGIDYVLNNLGEQTKKQKLRKKHQQYLKLYDLTILLYTERPNNQTIEGIISNIKVRSTKVKYDLQNQKSHEGHELIALIFALWSILKSSISEEGAVTYIYAPHPAQIIAIFCVLGIGDKGQLMGNRLAQVKTGEGKSVVLAGLSAYFGCLGYQVSCACYSKYLSQRDGNQFSVLFDKLRIRQHIKYGTFNEICQKILNPRGFQFRQQVLKTLKQPKVDLNKFKDMSKQLTDLKNYSTDSNHLPKNKILLIDQIDVFFSQDFYGKLYVPYVSVRHQTIQDLLSLVWDNRMNQISQIQNIVQNSNQLKLCIEQFPTLETIIGEAVKGMIGTVRNWQHDYIIFDDKIAYRQQDGISLTANYGYKTTFAYYYEYGRKNISRISRNNAAQIGLTVGQFSYAELPKYFTHILGVTGTLKTLSATKQEIVRNEYKITDNYFIPSVYDKPKLTHNGIKICKQEDYFEQIIKQTQRVINQNRPVIIFFDNYLKVSQFQSSQKFKSLAKSSMILSQQNEQNDREFRIQRSTTAGRITISTRSFSRGTDFNVFDTDLIERGGLHIIQTFLSEEESEQIQIIGRTARQGSKGSYKLIIKEDQFEKYSINLEVKGSNYSIQGKTNDKQQLSIINEKRNKYYNENYKRFLQQTAQLKDDHLKSMQMISNILNNQNSNVCEYVQKLNTFPELIIKKLRIIRTILGLDATGSMGQALLKTTKILGNSFNRVYDIIKQKSQDASFQIQIAVYRNYNSPIQQIFLFSPFESQPQNLTNFLKNIKASGGWGNQAVQVLYDHINQTENIDQVIIIGDAACNQFKETTTKRNEKGQKYWSRTKLQKPLNSEEQLKKIFEKKIPIHSFYILNPYSRYQKTTKEYFERISNESEGKYQQFKPSQKQAQDQLTDFIVTNILNKIGGQSLVQAYEIKFKSVVRH